MHDLRPSLRGVHASGTVVIGAGRGGRPRLAHLRTTAPLGVVLAGHEVHLMGTAGGPLGGDELSLSVTVQSGVDAIVRSVAATIALPGDGSPSRQRFTVSVAAGSSLHWLPQPLVAAAGCDHHVRADVHLESGAALVWRDELVLGRSGETAGAVTSTLRVARDGMPLVHHTLSTHQPGWAGPAITAGARVIAAVLHVGASAHTLSAGSGPTHCTTPLGEGVVLSTAVGADSLEVADRLGAAAGGGAAHR